jgi:hypothetical protein
MALQKRTAIVALIVGAALAVAAVLLIPVVFGVLTSSQTIPSNGILNPQFSTINRSFLLSLRVP